MPLSFLTKLFGSRNDRLLKQYRSVVTRINALESQYEGLSDEALEARLYRPAFRAETTPLLELPCLIVWPSCPSTFCPKKP